jgi:hypothetical protein
MLVGLVVDRCLEREEPARGPGDAFMVVPGRRRDLVGLIASPVSSEGCDDLRCLGGVDDGELVALAVGCCSCLEVGASRRPLVSLGSDMAGRGGDRGYISKRKAMGPGEIGGSSGDTDEES